MKGRASSRTNTDEKRKNEYSIAMPNKLKKAIGVFKDQTSIGLAHVSRHSSPGSSTRLEVVILKATSHDEVPVDDRHLTEVVILASSSPSAAAAVASALRRRISRTRNWVVALKCLFLLSSTISDSGPNFHPEAATQRILDLSLFSDDSSRSPWDFTAFIRTYALYLDARLQSALKGHVPPNNRRRSTFSTGMEPSLVLERIEHWQHILDRAIGTRPTGRAKTNLLIKLYLYNVVTETYDLYHNINRGLSLLLSKFLDLPYPSCVDTFEVCSKAAKQFEELEEFYANSKKMGIGRAVEYPSIQKIPGHLLQTLEKLLKDYQDLDVPMSAMLQSPPKLLLGTASPSADTCQESADMMAYSEGWEMALGESTRQSDGAYLHDSQKILKMKSTTSLILPRSCKNLFLDRRSSKGVVASPLSTPLLTSHVYETSKEAAQELKMASEPFAKSLAWIEKMDEPARQKLMIEQQLWLQHQNKLTETSLAW